MIFEPRLIDTSDRVLRCSTKKGFFLPLASFFAFFFCFFFFDKQILFILPLWFTIKTTMYETDKVPSRGCWEMRKNGEWTKI